MVEPVMIGLVLPCAAVAAPRRVELKHVEADWVPDVRVTALQHAVEPPLQRAMRLAYHSMRCHWPSVTTVALTFGVRHRKSPDIPAARAAGRRDTESGTAGRRRRRR